MLTNIERKKEACRLLRRIATIYRDGRIFWGPYGPVIHAKAGCSLLTAVMVMASDAGCATTKRPVLMSDGEVEWVSPVALEATLGLVRELGSVFPDTWDRNLPVSAVARVCESAARRIAA